MFPLWMLMTRFAAADSMVLMALTSPTVQVRRIAISSAYQNNVAPLFQASQISGTQHALMGWWAPHRDVTVFAALPVSFGHLGDAALGVRAQAWSSDRLSTGLGWWSWVPMATGDRGMPSGDELGLAMVGHVDASFRWLEVSGLAGLEIRGDPLRPASQDDLPVTWLHMLHRRPSVQLHTRVGGRWATARNPARLEAISGVERMISNQWSVGGEASAGLTPAAPTWGGRIWVGWRPASG